LDFNDLHVNRAGYLDRLDGLMYGDNPDQGIVRGRDFLHPLLRFALHFPDGWEVINTPTQVVARQSGEKVYMVLQLVTDPATRDLERLAGDNMRKSGFRLDSGGDTRVGDLEAFIGTFTGESTDAGEPRARVAYIDYGGLTDGAAYDRVESVFNTAILSFRPLSAAEAEDIRPNRLRFYTVRSRDTWQSIAQNAGQSIIPSNTLAVMNGVSVNEQPRRGDRIKIAVAGN
jgi:predicted Zn-dependent protease